ncbi:hypothetical protein AFUB_022050 [Aspergillus fumigatus A1163]|uniref:Uncharacterized protein n=1 Tax=Aspergillus fumigatus (strain CBS 144.89 / FGSC A1163 / CEA10) TaxID=451804 RepID=B0XVF3_ASPFC|nr:hypothetical protein AFUB_022050 [Aspergillus fumigatus A1163]
MIARKNAISLLRSWTPRLGPISTCGFSTFRTLRNTGTALPARKPVGAFRGGLFGFLAGTAVASASVYYYILGEYRVANQMLNEDIHDSPPLPSLPVPLGVLPRYIRTPECAQIDAMD